MRFTLKEYQADAVADVLTNLQDARYSYHRRGRPGSFSLTATTGAGKTVMAAAVIEALFNGNDDYNFEADSGAVVLWFTDDPSLNEQTRFRLLEASDLSHSRMKVIETSFQAEKLEPGNVYFLNAQKLGKNSLLVRGAPANDPDDPQQPLQYLPPPDGRANTMWDILRNTIEDKDLTLYLILDEAHRGMKAATNRDRREKATTVQRLVNGANDAPPIPIVWGISATVERFNQAMEKAEGRINFPNVVVDPARVQESGLLKDDIRLDFPAEDGQFDTVLLARATRRIREATAKWAEYAASQDPPVEPVAPLLVVQVPNKPTDELLLSAINTIRDEWPELDGKAMAHVFGDHKTIELGGHEVPHVSPETVQESDWIRILFAKDAISTGWDCPRAEVLMSFRPAEDETHITQLLGRMVRTPLARRIPGNDRLNSVECVLPRFNRRTATRVGEVLLGRKPGDDESGGTGGGEGRRVLRAPVDMQVNPSIPDFVWAAFDALPSQTLPRKAARPIKRLLALAQALSRDGLLEDARKKANADMCSVLDGLMARHVTAIEEVAYRILEVEGETIVAGIREPAPTFDIERFSELADDRTVEAVFKAAGRILTRDLALKYADHIAITSHDDDGLFDAHIKVAALAQVEGVAEELDRDADKLAHKWLDRYRVEIKGLADARRAAYDDIIAMSTEPQRIGILRPRVRSEETEDADGNRLATVTGHLMSIGDGRFPIGSLNNWEMKVLTAEMDRPDFLAWYRNPGRASDDSLAVAYQDGKGAWRRMCPDFLFFHGDENGVKVSIIDPHGHHLGDALPKLRGLAAFTAAFGDEFHRIEAVAQMRDETLRVLDLKEASVHRKIQSATDAEALYLGEAGNYL